MSAKKVISAITQFIADVYADSRLTVRGSAVGGVRHQNTTTVGNVLGGLDTLHSHTLSANALSTDGQGLLITAHGSCANNPNSKQMLLDIGGSYVGGGYPAISKVSYWSMTCEVYRVSATSIKTVATFHTHEASTPTSESTVTTNTLTKTLSSTLSITVQGVAVSTNDIVCEASRVVWYSEA